ncbi:hypothetical protein DV736_g976, partial [Chaetothyriales sp. CBS 134916]
MSFETRTPLLPPFGIRELYDTRTGILHISQSQYESTVRSYPNAVLSYVDDDDGEVITVGSGLELQQRLGEPIRAANRRPNSRLQGSTSRRGSMDDSMVHLFEIQHSDNVLAIWREHEAYSSKSLRSDRTSSVESDPEAAATPFVQQPDTVPADPNPTPPASQPEPFDPQPKVHSSAQLPNSVENTNVSLAATASIKAPSNDFRQDFDTVFSAACRGLESLGLADILDNTAQALHSLAQKTRDTDASPVETLLGGLKDVATEISKLGLEVLNDLNKETPLATNTHTTPPAPHHEIFVCKCAKKAEAKMAGKMQTLPVLALESPQRVSFANLQDEIRTAFAGSDPAGAEQPQPDKTSTSKSDLLLSAPSLPAPLNLQRTLNWSVPILPQPADNSPSSSMPASIMDIESSNPDFTARYPPLTSLRRAQTISELLKKNHDAAPSNIVPTTTKAALTRYPTMGQLEAQRIAVGPSGRDQVAAMQADMLRRRNQIKADSLSNNYRAQSAEDAGQYRALPYPLLHTFPSARAVSSATKPLPGLWPEMHCDQAGVNPAIESSGAFFNRMAGIEPSVPKRSLSPAVSYRATSPPADQYYPSTGLRRAQTVTASDPAARLTRPFDSLTNAPRLEPSRYYHHDGPLPQRSFSLQQRRHMKPPSSAAGQDAPLLTLPRSQLPSMVPPPRPPPVTQGHPLPVPLPVPLRTWHSVDDTAAPMNPSNLIPRPVLSVPNFHHPSLTPSRGHGQSSPWAQNRIDECVKTLTKMGYGIQPNEAARLHVYASAASGELDEAIDMIEEDRKAAESLFSASATVRVL